MKDTVIYDKEYKWIVFGRDPDKPSKVIDTNQYMICDANRSLLLDPGGTELFSSMLAAVMRHTDINKSIDLFASHQDPDIISSLGLWDRALPDAKLYAPALWEGFIRHFGCTNIEYIPISDDGGTISLEHVQLQLIPAHYLHSSANFHVYDPEAKILMSGDVGAALEHDTAPMFVDDFNQHVTKMTYFHQRWMPSDKAKSDWVSRVRKLDIEMMVPQHGRIFKRDDVKRFLDWFEILEVGIIGKQAKQKAA